MNQRIISANELQLACHTQGEGAPLLLIHGFPFDHTMWEPQIETLASKCRVIAPDLRGYGGSTQHDDDATIGVDMGTYAADLVDILDQLEINEPVILCGFSMGGYILWQFALKYPDHVRALVLCDTRAAADSTEASEGRIKMADTIADTGVEPLVEGLTPKLLAAETLDSRPEIVKKVQAMIRDASPAAIAASQRGMARREDVRNQLATFEGPSLVLVGAEDAISPPDEMREIADCMPQAKFQEIAKAGHMTVLENPEAVNDALQAFLDELL